MPNPKYLKIGDYIKYISRPKEWESIDFKVCQFDIEFLDNLIVRGRWQRISQIDEYDNPWIFVRLRVGNQIEQHSWAIFEKSGWIKK